MGGDGWLSGFVGRLYGHLFVWVPVAMACGIGLWLGRPADPGAAELVLAGAGGLAGLLAGWRGGVVLRPLGIGILCLSAGFLAAEVRSAHVAGPVLEWRYYGPVTGRIVLIDRSQSDRIRLTLDEVALDRVAPERVPRRVRIALHGPDDLIPLVPGARVMMTAHLAAPDGPVEPGGFDFQRMAWFRMLGAVGYTRTPVLLAAEPATGALPVTALRMRISRAVQEAVPGQPGAFAAAILTGDRSGIDQTVMQDFRDSNLAHLLAISGLHMGLLTGFVFVAMRRGLALIPALALRLPVKKLAACIALGAAAFYLALSGGNVATERAFVMVAVMLVAVLVDRQAISLRSLAIAAVIILTLRPETLAEPGFQMSFAATAALVAGFGALRRRPPPERDPWGMPAKAPRGLAGALRGGRLPPVLRPVAGLVVASVLAGVATAPIAAAHFGRVAEYGLIANLLAVPLMGTVVIPAAVIAGVLAPLGLSALPLWAMEQGARWILWVANLVAGLDGAVIAVPQPAHWVLPVAALAGMWLVAVPGRRRLGAVVPMVACLWLWQGEGRPEVLISADGGLVGVMGPAGRALSAPRGNGFAARVWLENDGDKATQAEAAARAGFSGDDGARGFDIGTARAIHLRGRGAAARLTAACAEARLVILAAERDTEDLVPEGCNVIDQAFLARTGPVALRLRADGQVQLTPALRGARVWSPGRAAAGAMTLDLSGGALLADGAGQGQRAGLGAE